MKRMIFALAAAGFALVTAGAAQADSGWGGGIKYGSAAGAYGKFAYGNGFADGRVNGQCGSKCKGSSTSYANNHSMKGKYSVSNESFATNTVTFHGSGMKGNSDDYGSSSDDHGSSKNSKKKPKKNDDDHGGYGSSGSAMIHSYSSALSGSGIGNGHGYKNGYVKRY